MISVPNFRSAGPKILKLKSSAIDNSKPLKLQTWNFDIVFASYMPTYCTKIEVVTKLLPILLKIYFLDPNLAPIVNNSSPLTAKPITITRSYVNQFGSYWLWHFKKCFFRKMSAKFNWSNYPIFCKGFVTFLVLQ